MHFGCEPCKLGDHDLCESIWSYDKDANGKILGGRKRPQPSPTHCDCQHRVGKS